MKRLLIVCSALACAPVLAEESKFDIGQCYAAMWADSRATPAAERIGIGKSPIPLALRASKLKPNAKEKEALSFVADAMQNCQQLDQPNRAKYHPLTKQMVDEFESGMRSNLTKVYAGDMTWGGLIEANEADAAKFDARAKELHALGEAIRKESEEREAQAEERRKAVLRADFERQQRAEAQQRYMEQQRQEQASRDFTNGLLLLNAARPRPAPMMPPVSCSSRNVGGTVYTDCR